MYALLLNSPLLPHAVNNLSCIVTTLHPLRHAWLQSLDSYRQHQCSIVLKRATNLDQHGCVRLLLRAGVQRAAARGAPLAATAAP